MQTFIAGATGRVAEVLIKELVAQGHTVVAGARSPEKVLQLEGVHPVHLDLHAEVAPLAELIQGSDAVYFVAGSRGQDLLQTDAFGAVKLMQASEKARIKRFIMLSSIFATEPEKWAESDLSKITNYNIAKFFADKWLIHHTGLDYTIVQPGTLVEAAEGSGRIQIGVEKPQPNTIPNVAKVLAEVLEAKNTYGTIIQMSDGDTPIADAIRAIGA
ncbi:SDR family oxidoreductase [Rothia sp. CCM 9417]|uniref:SDR family oxidoreductase n=1 Tax=Rothia sp. CCM 9417 TaxID=3402657 RepID=UPI003AE3DE07